MIKKECFSRDWIYHVRATHFPKSAPQILEKTIHSFELLCLLVKSKIPFVFKGGSSLLLLLSDFKRIRPMKKEIIQHIINDFELYSSPTQKGIEYRFDCGQLIQRLTRVGRV